MKPSVDFNSLVLIRVLISTTSYQCVWLLQQGATAFISTRCITSKLPHLGPGLGRAHVLSRVLLGRVWARPLAGTPLCARARPRPRPMYCGFGVRHLVEINAPRLVEINRLNGNRL